MQSRSGCVQQQIYSKRRLIFLLAGKKYAAVVQQPRQRDLRNGDALAFGDSAHHVHAVKGAIFAANLYEKLGFKVIPDGKEDRHDIIQAVEFHDPEKLIAFCEGIQKASPIDSHVTPIPWDMPGYDSQVIMAAGTFVSGASIELSADGPMKEPYAVYFQGGLTYPHAKYGIIMSLQRMAEKGLVEIPEIS